MSLKSALRSLCLTERICSCVSAPNVVLGGGGLVVDDEDDAGDAALRVGHVLELTLKADEEASAGWGSGYAMMEIMLPRE